MSLKKCLNTEGMLKESIGDVTASDFLKNTLKEPAFMAIRDAYLINFVIKPLMNVELLSGEKIPTFKIATLTYKDTELFELQREFEDTSKGVFNSLLIKEDPVILGTGTKLEAVNKNTNKAAVKFSPSENCMSDFHNDFLKNIVQNKMFSVIIGKLF
jgi:hypothetical protein